MKSSHIQVDYYPINAEYLPFPDNTFDTVVSTFTLCSIKDIHRALSEIARVLRPNGRFFLPNMVLALIIRVRKWRHRLNSINKVLSCGCNLNRNIKRTHRILQLKDFKGRPIYLEKTPKIFGYLYKGMVTINPS